MLWLYLHFPTLQLDGLDPDIELSIPLIIVDSKLNRVLQCNRAATASGITTGMGLGTAATLCPHLNVLDYQESKEVNQLTHLAQLAYQLTCDIAIMPPQGLLLRVSNMLAIYGELSHYWQQIQQWLGNFNYHYHYATAYSPIAAQLLAQNQYDEISQQHQSIDNALAEITIERLALAPTTIAKLQRLGINKLSQLLTVPLKELARRFDIELVNYLGKLSGELKTPVTFYQPSQIFSHYLEFNYEIHTTATLSHPLTKLFNRLEHFLVQRDALACELKLTLHHRDIPAVSLSLYSAAGEYKTQPWLALSALYLERVRLEAPVIALTLSSSQVIDKNSSGNDLFKGKQGLLSNKELISLLEAKLGKNMVSHLAITDQHAPEQANNITLALTASNGKEAVNELPKLRPSYLLPIPQPLTKKISLSHGPERIQTLWWTGHELTRDYYIGQTAQQQWCWVFKQPDNRWFIHGYFG